MTLKVGDDISLSQHDGELYMSIFDDSSNATVTELVLNREQLVQENPDISITDWTIFGNAAFLSISAPSNSIMELANDPYHVA